MFSRLLEIALVAPLPRNDILLNKNASSTLRTKHSLRLAQGGGSAVPPQFTLSGALCSRPSSACAVTVRSRARSTDPLITGYWSLDFLRHFFRATFSAGVLWGLPAMASIHKVLDQRPPSLSALPVAYSSRSEFWWLYTSQNGESRHKFPGL